VSRPPRLRRRLLGTALSLAVLLGTPRCTPRTQAQPEENPLLADLVDYRNGLSLLREGRADEAIQLLRRAQVSHPTDPAVPNALGLALLYKRDYGAALKAFNASIKLDPGFMEARNNRGVCLMEAGKLDDAVPDFQFVIDGPPSNEKNNARFNLGLVFKKHGDWAAAEAQFSAVVSADPLYKGGYRERGLVRMKQDQHRLALEDFLASLKIEPKDHVSNYQAALCLLTTGRRDLAVRYMQRALEAGPETDEGQRARRFLESEKPIVEGAR